MDYSWDRGAMDGVWVGRLVVVLSSEKISKGCRIAKTIYHPSISVLKLLYEDRTQQCPAYRGGKPRKFVPAPEIKERTMKGRPGTRRLVYYPENKEKIFENILKMKDPAVPENRISFGLGYLDYAVLRWEGTHVLRYHNNEVPEAEILNFLFFLRMVLCFDWSQEHQDMKGRPLGRKNNMK